MVTVVEREINLQRRLESLKRECQLGLDFSSLAALRSIDRYNAGTFTSVELGAFLRSQGHFATETELMAIIRRIDVDGDA